MKYLLLFIIFCSNVFCFAQSMDEFAKDFEKSLDKNFDEKRLNKMFRDYSNLLTPHSGVTNLMAELKGETILEYPLEDFIKNPNHKKKLDVLIHSENANQRILAYLVIAGSGDKSYENLLLDRIDSETNKGNLIWSGMALLYLKTKHTTALFDFLVENENLGDAHMFPLFINLNRDSLQGTAYSRISSDNKKAKILSAQILAYTERNEITEELLLNAVKTWDYNIKGYAIFSVKELGIGNLLESFKPLLDSTKTRSIAIEALANSPTENDVNFLKQLVAKQDTIQEDLLDGFFKSKNLENVKYWLILLWTKNIPSKYYFSVNGQPLLSSDEILPELQLTLDKSDNPEVIQNLIRALKGRTDEKSINIFLKLLNHEDSSVRYWTAFSLKGNNSPLILKKIVRLIKDPFSRKVSFTDLLIENNIDSLQSTFESIYFDNPGRDWKRSSIEYLSYFPLPKHKNIFRNILEDEKEDTFIKRNAALGLGSLKDNESVSLIINACEYESESSDYNAQIFLSALAMIKGEEAKKYISKYKDSKEETVQALVNEILDNW